MKLLERIIYWLNAAFVAVAGVFLVAMALLTCLNIAFRLAGSPIQGSVELVGFFGAITATFALAYTQLKKDHICVTVVIEKFPNKMRRLIGCINDLLCMLFSLAAAFQISRLAGIILKSGEVSESLRIGFHPFIYAAAAGFGLLSLVFLAEIIKYAIEGFVKEPSPYEKEFEPEQG